MKITRSLDIFQVVQDLSKINDIKMQFEEFRLEVHFEEHGDEFASIRVRAPLLSKKQASIFSVGLRFLADELDKWSGS